jgi:hypothetical protein
MRSVIRGAFIFIGSFAILGLLLAPTSLFAAQSLPFSASFNCPAWNQNGQEVLPTGCTDIADSSFFGEPAGVCTDSTGSYGLMLTSAANRSGSTGLGERTWIGGTTGTSYVNGLGINFTPTSSVNIRWYERYQAGIDLGGQLHKDIYARNTAANWTNFSIPEPNGGEYVVAIETVGSNIAMPGVTLSSIMDGNWHCYELHMDPGNVSFWIDGTQQLSQSISLSNTWSAVVFGSNTGDYAINTRTCSYVDYDDIAITAGTYIGPTGAATGSSSSGSSSGSGSTTLPAPTDLQVVQ